MSIEYVDFNDIDPSHFAIHARLENWAHWARDRLPAGRGGAPRSSPMFDRYRSTEAAQVHGKEACIPVDKLDAFKVQAGVSKLPPPHAKAISWAYIFKQNPRAAAASLEVTMAGLHRLVTDGRVMLKNRQV